MDDNCSGSDKLDQSQTWVELEMRNSAKARADELLGLDQIKTVTIDSDPMIAKVQSAKRESKYVEFKRSFDITSKAEWCEILKDFVAMANTGGGIVVIGVNDNGQPSDFDISPLLELDPAVVADKITKYTGVHYSEFYMTELPRHGRPVFVFRFHEASYPITFINPGTYVHNGDKQKTAFGRGVTYFRHHAKSEPADNDDLRKFVDRKVEELRQQWLGNISKIVNAPVGTAMQVVETTAFESDNESAMPVRIVDDPSAPAVRRGRKRGHSTFRHKVECPPCCSRTACRKPRCRAPGVSSRVGLFPAI